MPTSSQQASKPAHEPESATSTSELVGKGAFRLVGEGEQNQETLSQGRLAAGGEQEAKARKTLQNRRRSSRRRTVLEQSWRRTGAGAGG